MINLTFKHGLLYTDIMLKHENKEVVVKDVIVDTGASHSIISPIFLEKLETEYSEDDEIVNAFGLGGTICSSLRKRIDEVKCGEIIVDNFKIDFGEIDPEDRINGLLGLDFLRKISAVIDSSENIIMFKKI